ncbi:netrin receptor UNC5B-like [Anneissia japonica]|uniref:netrin receptor UNC5B-like n=1 Tax=Anneissia japonica TaxID=1529436 RepID=UPI001425B507|nr:netrin receptor UNC5B-like [Anneissia japonica]
MHHSNNSKAKCNKSGDGISDAVLAVGVIFLSLVLFLLIKFLCRILCHRKLTVRCVKIRQTEDVESRIVEQQSAGISTISGHLHQGPILTSNMVVPYTNAVVDNPVYIEDVEIGSPVIASDSNFVFSTPPRRHDFQLDEFEHDMSISKTITIESKLVVYICRMIGSQGGLLELDQMGISLFIPPGAIPEGVEERIFLILDWDLTDFPLMTDLQTIISPVVHCGPHGLILNKPAVLKFKHCAYDRNDIEVFSSETNLMYDKAWMKISERENGEKPYILTPTECQIHITHFTLYTSIAEGHDTRKWLQIVAFAGPMRVGCHFQVRLYFLNNTPCALQFAKQNEAKQNFYQICPEQVFLFHGNEQDMLIRLDYKSEGWSCSNDQTERISYLSIWHGKCPHLSFIFKHENISVQDISFCLKTFQKGREDDFLNFKILHSLPPPSVNNDSALKPCNHIGLKTNPVLNIENDHGYCSQGNSPKVNKHYRKDSEHSTTNIYINSSSMDNINIASPCTFEVIPHQLQMDLVMLLDPPSLLGKDWRIVASALDLDATIPLLKNQPSPTTHLLQSLVQQDKTMDWLAEILLKNDRLDAANVIMKVCKQQQELEKCE